MDLSKPGDVKQHERFEIATGMHALILNHIFHATDWRAPHAVFHGGTALSMLRRSDRSSEDLDFMVDESAYAILDKVIAKVHRKVDAHFAAVIPGAKVELYGPKGNEVRSWDFRWAHPNRRNKVTVKIEFLKTSTDLLRNYRTAHIMPTPAGKAIFSITTPIPAPEMVSAWADKVKAIATRPDFKWRDAYDLAFIHDRFQDRTWRAEAVDDDVLLDALASTAAIYGKTTEHVDEGLAAVLEKGILDNVAAFEKEMGRWLDRERWETYSSHGMFAEMLGKTRHEIERARALVAAAAPSVSEVRP